jgi:hypothetical protein
MNYKVTCSIDCGAWVDPNPTIKTFDNHDEMEDWISDYVQTKVDCIINDRNQCSENELKEIEENEWSMIKIEEV